MPRGEMLTVFTYDVGQNRRRRRVAKLLEDAATRVQYSVFEARLTKARAEALAQRIAAELGEGDSLRVYVISADGEVRSRIYGDGPPMEADADYWLF
jgi:CRISPR-associated protein Cas2